MIDTHANIASCQTIKVPFGKYFIYRITFGIRDSNCRQRGIKIYYRRFNSFKKLLKTLKGPLEKIEASASDFMENEIDTNYKSLIDRVYD